MAERNTFWVMARAKQWIVDHHRGSITVSNREGGGAQFRVRLPSQESAPA